MTLRSAPKPEKKNRKKRKLTPLPSLIKKADIVFSKFIRNRDAIALKGKCCTCGKPGNQAGHFINRSHKSVRWNTQNVHLQCCACNHFKSGNLDSYAKFIIERYGIERFNWLISQKGVVRKVSRSELEQIIDAYGEEP